MHFFVFTTYYSSNFGSLFSPDEIDSDQVPLKRLVSNLLSRIWCFMESKALARSKSLIILFFSPICCIPDGLLLRLSHKSLFKLFYYT